MNKQKISEMLAVFPMTESARKSVANRIESALSKNGTPAQLLSSASQSLRKRAEETPDTPDYGAIIGIATALDFAREIINAGKEAKKSAKREYWAESQEEALALKAQGLPLGFSLGCSNRKQTWTRGHGTHKCRYPMSGSPSVVGF